MKNAKFFLFLAAFMVAIACGGNPPPTDGQNPNNPDPGMVNPDPNQGCEPNCPPTPEIKMSMLSLMSNPGGHVLVDGRDTGLMAIINVPVMVEAEVGRRDVCVARDSARPEVTRVMCVLDAEFDERTMGQRITDADGYRSYTGDWGRKDFPNEAARPWDMRWDCNDPRIPGTSVCILEDEIIKRGVYTNNLLGFCADPADIQAALAEGRAPRVVATTECNDYLIWGRTIDDINGMKGEEIENYQKYLGIPDSPVTRVDWQRLVPVR